MQGIVYTVKMTPALIKFILSSVVLSVVAGTASDLGAQSGSTPNTVAGKANRRKPEASPTPTPILETAAVSNPRVNGLDDGDVIKVVTQVVSIPVRVMDKKGRFVGGLTKENFKAFEDGVEQQISLFSNETQPFTVALVLDMSYSTTFKISEIQSAAITFIDQLRPQDKVTVISFDDEVHVLCESTSDRKAIYRAIRSTKIATGTSLYEAVDLTINDHMRRVEGRKAIILFTDGVDTSSKRVGSQDNLNDAMEADSLIYIVRYDTFADVQKMKNETMLPKPPPIKNPLPKKSGDVTPDLIGTIGIPDSQGTTPEEYQRAGEYLDQLSTRTGGRIYLADSLVNLADAYSKIASELREFYSIGYYPSTERVAEKRTTVKIRVDRPGLAVRSRDTYVIAKKRLATKPTLK